MCFCLWACIVQRKVTAHGPASSMMQWNVQISLKGIYSSLPLPVSLEETGILTAVLMHEQVGHQVIICLFDLKYCLNH